MSAMFWSIKNGIDFFCLTLGISTGEFYRISLLIMGLKAVQCALCQHMTNKETREKQLKRDVDTYKYQIELDDINEGKRY